MEAKYYVYDKWSDDKDWELEYAYENEKYALQNARYIRDVARAQCSEKYMVKVVYKKKIIWKSY